MEPSFTSILQRIASQFSENLPAILTILLIIIIGWLISRVVAGLIRRFINRTGLNQTFKRSDISTELDKVIPEHSLSELAAGFTFWLLWLFIIFSALTSSGLNLETTPFIIILSFLPRLFAAFLILVGGVLLAQFIGRWVQVGVAATGVEYHEALGKGTRLVLIVIAVITAIEELGIDLSPLTNALTNIITIMVGGLALAFAIGSRDVVRNILAGYYLREHFDIGNQIQIENETGILNAIGTINAEIVLPDERLIVPNSDLTEKMVKVKERQT